MQPVTVRVEAVLNVILGYADVVVGCKLFGFLPGSDLKFEKFKVSFVRSMTKHAMTELMQKCPTGRFCCFIFIIEYGVIFWRPIELGACLYGDCREVMRQFLGELGKGSEGSCLAHRCCIASS